jgi:hypothetical protein
MPCYDKGAWLLRQSSITSKELVSAVTLIREHTRAIDKALLAVRRASQHYRVNQDTKLRERIQVENDIAVRERNKSRSCLTRSEHYELLKSSEQWPEVVASKNERIGPNNGKKGALLRERYLGGFCW